MTTTDAAPIVPVVRRHRERPQARHHLLQGQPRHGLPGPDPGQRRARRGRRDPPVLHLLGLRHDQQEDDGRPEVHDARQHRDPHAAGPRRPARHDRDGHPPDEEGRSPTSAYPRSRSSCSRSSTPAVTCGPAGCRPTCSTSTWTTSTRRSRPSSAPPTSSRRPRAPSCSSSEPANDPGAPLVPDHGDLRSSSRACSGGEARDVQEVRIDAAPLERLEHLLPLLAWRSWSGPPRTRAACSPGGRSGTSTRPRRAAASRRCCRSCSPTGAEPGWTPAGSCSRATRSSSRSPSGCTTCCTAHPATAAAGAAPSEHFLEVSRATPRSLPRWSGPGTWCCCTTRRPPGWSHRSASRAPRRLALPRRVRDGHRERPTQAWGFLRALVEPADAFVFSRPPTCPRWLPPDRVRIIAAVDRPVQHQERRAGAGRVGADPAPGRPGRPAGGRGSLAFGAREGDGRHRAGAPRPAPRRRPVPGDARIVLQVSRWDRLKDMTGVLTGFADHLDAPARRRAPGAGRARRPGGLRRPRGRGGAGDVPVAARQLPRRRATRIHLCCLPMDDVDENAHLVNALQRHAAVVVQKSLAEGFGLTVTEPMWKARPVVASARRRHPGPDRGRRQRGAAARPDRRRGP